MWVCPYLCIRQHRKGFFGSALAERPPLPAVDRRAFADLRRLRVCGAACGSEQSGSDGDDLLRDPVCKGVTCSGRSAGCIPRPGTPAGPGAATWAPPARRRRFPSGVTPAILCTNLRTSASVPFSLGDYQEFNETLLEVTIPPEAQVELTMERRLSEGGPQPLPPDAGRQGRSATRTFVLENAALSPSAERCYRWTYPVEIEIAAGPCARARARRGGPSGGA